MSVSSKSEDDVERLGAVLRGGDVVTVHCDGPRHEEPHGLLVVGNQDFCHQLAPAAMSRRWKNRTAISRPSAGGDARRDLNASRSLAFSTGCSSTEFHA